MQAATWALNRGVSVVICNGMQEKAIKSIVLGRKIGTFFTNAPTANATPVETLAENGTLKLFFLISYRSITILLFEFSLLNIINFSDK